MLELHPSPNFIIILYPALVTATCSALLCAQRASPLHTAPPIPLYGPLPSSGLPIQSVSCTAGSAHPSASTEGANLSPDTQGRYFRNSSLSWHHLPISGSSILLNLVSFLPFYLFLVCFSTQMSKFFKGSVSMSALNCVTFLGSRAVSGWKRCWIHLNDVY